MIRSALILAAGLLAAACFACAPPPPPPPPPPAPVAAMNVMPGRSSGRALDCVGKPFAENVLLLDNSTFHGPAAVSPNYTPPSGTLLTNSDRDKVIKSDLQKAYDIAPPFFQTQLCQLDGIFIDPGRSYSWGYRENKDNQDPLMRKYIGLSAALWQGVSHAPAFTTYETGVLNTLLGLPVPQYSFANPDTPEINILGLLAHEMGHILWFHKNIAKSLCTPPPPGTQPMFHQHSWFRMTSNYPQFHYFGFDIAGNLPIDRPVRNDVQQDILTNQTEVPNDIIDIYGDEWASLFATVSPDEDFVETYELVVLTSSLTSPLVALQVTPTLGAQPIDFIPGVVSNLGTTVYRKMLWIRGCGVLSPL